MGPTLPASDRTVRAAACLLVAALALAPTVAGQPVDRVPNELPDAAVDYRDSLAEVAQANGSAAMRRALDDAEQLAPDVVPHLQDLGGTDGDLLVELRQLLGHEVRAGNLSNARSLADQAVNTLDDELIPRARDWAANGTTVTPGTLDGGRRVPLVMIDPPAAGLGAFDLTVAADGQVVPTGASVAVGQGQARVDAANASARLASFDAKALAGLASSGRVVVLGHVTYSADAGELTLDVEVRELVDPDAEPIPAVSPPGTVRVADGATALTPGTVGLAAVGVLGVGAIVGVRRFVRL